RLRRARLRRARLRRARLRRARLRRARLRRARLRRARPRRARRCEAPRRKPAPGKAPSRNATGLRGRRTCDLCRGRHSATLRSAGRDHGRRCL
ncbi:pentapeptide repeat-containing protein, partial [Streptomyces sp. NPDC002589]|uniref:pentapeptide repeat-containing protein n=1 Tax=Streptomyces sp. NPDC002589 TaxID=3154420 RepID=UPI00331F2695